MSLHHPISCKIDRRPLSRYYFFNFDVYLGCLIFWGDVFDSPTSIANIDVGNLDLVVAKHPRR